ncbi:MAG: RNA-binding protein [Bacteroidetes bacterium]|nr:RNA-binding protein [Bacteroidota bacterium]MBU1720947.1 RNA-binding protein [Bacteroidota bacterium]
MNIFVANLNRKINGNQLQELFASFGEVSSARVIFDKETRQSKGFGFVEMPEEEDANRAIQELDGKEIQGRAIVVKVARPKEE